VENPPLIRWQDGGQLWQIDATGRAVRADGDAEEGWSIQGPLPIDDEQRLQDSVRVGLQELAGLDIDLSGGLYYSPDRGIGFVDEQGLVVIVGTGPGMALRLASLDRVRAGLAATGVTPEWVDVHIANRPYFEVPAGQAQRAASEER
jgi:hypothetical protein